MDVDSMSSQVCFRPPTTTLPIVLWLYCTCVGCSSLVREGIKVGDRFFQSGWRFKRCKKIIHTCIHTQKQSELIFCGNFSPRSISYMVIMKIMGPLFMKLQCLKMHLIWPPSALHNGLNLIVKTILEHIQIWWIILSKWNFDFYTIVWDSHTIQHVTVA